MSSASSFHESNTVRNQHRSASYASDSSSTATAYAVLASIVIYYLIRYIDPSSLPLLEILWNAIVWVTPSRLIARMDTSFEKASAEETRNTEGSSDPKGHASKSNALRRILGLDGTGLLTTMQRTRTLSNLGNVFKATSNIGLPGLGNWDNSCYQNSVLQSLAALEHLPPFLAQRSQSEDSHSTMTALEDFITRLNDPANAGKTFWTPAQLKSMSSWQQQDAQEYFSKISDELEKDSSMNSPRMLINKGLEELTLETRNIESSTLANTVSASQSTQGNLKGPQFNRLPDELIAIMTRSPLEGLLAQRVGCQKCGYVEGLSLVPFNCLTVPLGRGWIYDIRDCLDEYTSLELINGVECAKCTLLRAQQSLEQVLRSIKDRSPVEDQPLDHAESNIQQVKSLEGRLEVVTRTLEDEDFSDQALSKCQIPPKNRVSSTKSRQAVIARGPKSLVIHVNRSNFDEVTGLQSKNLANVRFPRELDLAPWCLGETPGPSGRKNGTESWNTDPFKSMLSEDGLEGIDSYRCYKLRAVITHYGRHENGHYVCYRKSPYSTRINGTDNEDGNDPWWRLSDEDVTEVDEEIVLSQAGVFMLFFEQSTSATQSWNLQKPLESSPSEEISQTPKEVPKSTKAIKDEDPSSTTDPDLSSEAQAELTLLTPPPTPPQHHPETKSSTPIECHQSKQEFDSDETIKSTSLDPQGPAPSVISSNQPEPPHIPEPSSPKSSETQSPLPEQSTLRKPLEKLHAASLVSHAAAVSPVSMRTAAPRGGSGSVDRLDKAIGSVAGFVQAN